jgi:valyl-tRNA synthetase
LLRTLVLPNGAIVSVRVHMPRMTDKYDMEEAHVRIQKELQKLQRKKKKFEKMLKKIKNATSRQTYLQEAPPDVQSRDLMRVSELEADLNDVDAVSNILRSF